MSIINWEHFFKPEVRSAGRALYNKGKVSLSQPSDTEIVIFIRATPGFKVILKTASVESHEAIVSCSCPVAKKDKFCKHAWAGILAAADKYSDFFESKTELEKNEISTNKTESYSKPSTKSFVKSDEFAAKQAAYKQKQTEYRKQQYQKQKEKQKAYKDSKKEVIKKIEYPKDVERALNFFSDNGMNLRECLDKQTISAAKKKLARVFHPDLGGDHEEIVELNNCAEILLEFISKKV